MANLTFSTTHSGCSAAKNLQIDIAGDCSDLMQIELQVPKSIASADLAAKAEAASHNSRGNPNAANALVKRSDTSWKAWVDEGSNGVILVRLTNFRDDSYKFLKKNGYGKIASGTPLSVTLPLNTSLAAQTQVDLKYSYGGKKHGHRVVFGGHFITEGSLNKLCFMPQGQNHASAPDIHVSFETNHPSDQTALPIGAEVELKWEVKNGVSGKIIGPMAEGLTEMPLDFSNADSNGVSKGNFTVRAFGQQAYLLDVTVKGSPDNIDVLHTLVLDIQNAENYGAVWVDKPRVFLGETVNVHWAAWGINGAAIDIKPENGSETTRTVLKKSATAATGQGFLPHTIDTRGKTDFLLQLNIDGTLSYIDANPDVQVIEWESAGQALPEPGNNPLKMVFATDDKSGTLGMMFPNAIFFDAKVGAQDPGTNILPPLNFNVKEPITSADGEWMDIAALADGFVALRRQERNFDLVRFNLAGNVVDAMPLPDWFSFSPLFENKTNYTQFWGKLAAIQQKVFVLGGCQEDPDWTPTPFSADYSNSSRNVPPKIEMVENLYAFKNCDDIITIENDFFAIYRSERKIVCGANVISTEIPRHQIADIPEKQASALTNAVPVVIGGLLVLLNCGSGANKKDWVWNSKTNHWTETSLNIDVQNSLIAYRGGDSPRLWAANCHPRGKTDNAVMHTIPIFGGETFFVSDYFKKNPPVVYEQIPLKPLVSTDLYNNTSFYLSAQLGYLNKTLADHNKMPSAPGIWISGPIASINQPSSDIRSHTSDKHFYIYPTVPSKPVRLKRLWMVAKNGQFPLSWVKRNDSRLVVSMNITREKGKITRLEPAIQELTVAGELITINAKSGYQVIKPRPGGHTQPYFDYAPVKLTIMNFIPDYYIHSDDLGIASIAPTKASQLTIESDSAKIGKFEIRNSKKDGTAGVFWLSYKFGQSIEPGIEILKLNHSQLAGAQTKTLALSQENGRHDQGVDPKKFKLILAKNNLVEDDDYRHYTLYVVASEARSIVILNNLSCTSGSPFNRSPNKDEFMLEVDAGNGNEIVYPWTVMTVGKVVSLGDKMYANANKITLQPSIMGGGNITGYNIEIKSNGSAGKQRAAVQFNKNNYTVYYTVIKLA